MNKKFTDDVELRQEILLQLNKNKKNYGKPYCPCVLPEYWNDDFICPCKNFRDNISVGEECHCGLYIKISD